MSHGARLAQVRAALVEQGTGSGGTHALAGPALVAGALAAGEHPLGSRQVLAAVSSLSAALTGAGPLQVLLDDPAITDVLVNGPRQVWVDSGAGLRQIEVDLGEESDVRALAVRLAAASGRRLDEASPCVDARLPQGVRLHAVLPPVSPGGTLLSLRVPARRAFSLAELTGAGTVPPGWDLVLDQVVRRRLGFLVSGGTGSGKTTLLSCLLGRADPAERIVTVEDTVELSPRCPHLVRLEARRANAEGVGAISLSELVRQALRMRPDRIVVGECRGAEVTDLLAALNTGHAGGCGTVHANAARHVPARLEALGMLAGISREALARQMDSALDVVVHLERPAGLRRIMSVGVLAAAEDGQVQVVEGLRADARDPGSPGTRGPGWPALAALLDGRSRG